MASKESRDIRKQLASDGWTFVQTRNGHWKGTHPKAARFIIVSGSPGDHRTKMNTLAEAKRALRDAA